MRSIQPRDYNSSTNLKDISRFVHSFVESLTQPSAYPSINEDADSKYSISGITKITADKLLNEITMAIFETTNHELLGCFAAGVVLHHAVFRHGEWDAHSDTLLHVTIAAQVLLSLFAHELFSESVAASLQHGMLWLASATAGLFTSMLVYRVFFHRLRHFPGPFGSRISQFYMTWKCYRRGQIYEDVRALHRQYGDYVRVGPSEISIADPAAFNAIHSPTSQCERGPWYNIINPQISLQMVRNRKEHSVRRRPWDRAFSSKGKYDLGRAPLALNQKL